MRFGILGDTHFTNRGPKRRLDNYFETQLDKFNQSLDIFEKEECDYVTQVGDFFDSPDVSNYVISTIISLLRQRKVEILCCYGQHDITGHSASTLKRSPLKVLESAGVVRILSQSPIQLQNSRTPVDNDKRYAMLYGSSFGETIPKTLEEDPYNILVTHRMIGDRELYPGQELTSPRKFLRDNPSFNLVLAGDYHYRYSDSYQGRVIVNPGCLMRKTIKEFDLEHRPGVAVFDVNTNELMIHELRVRPVVEVFDLSRKDVKDNEKLLRFIESLKESNESRVDWKRNLVRVLGERKSNQDVREIINNAMSKVKGETNG